MTLFLLCLPWILVGLYVALFFHDPPSLPEVEEQAEDASVSRSEAEAQPEALPFVSVIVPARNEEANIGRCISSLLASRYPAFEILVVDDESHDRTREIVQELARESGESVCFIEGEPLPPGWLGKPWACWQGAEQARGDFLLFTDADTEHGPELLAQAVRGREEAKADVLTIIGLQVLGSFWERLIQPQFFMLLAGRFPLAGTPRKKHQWRHAIANGQYLLFERSVYEAVGGHQAVAGDVVEDMRLAHILVRGGWRLVVRGTEALSTRMYRSLGDLVEGWSKNVATAALQSSSAWFQPIILPLSAMVAVTLWLMPPAVLLLALAAGGPAMALQWGALTTGVNVLIWARASMLLRSSPLFGILYPLGCIVGYVIFMKSWLQGPRIKWKARKYEIPEEVRKGSSARAEDTDA